jgi:hypothetical protein
VVSEQLSVRRVIRREREVPKLEGENTEYRRQKTEEEVSKVEKPVTSDK